MSKLVESLILRIQRRMDALGIDQAELARRCNQAPQAVNRWIKGKTVPSLDTAETLASALETTLSELLDTGEEPTPSAIPPDVREMLEHASADQIRAIRLTLEGFGLGREKRALADKAKQLRNKAK